MDSCIQQEIEDGAKETGQNKETTKEKSSNKKKLIKVIDVNLIPITCAGRIDIKSGT